MQEHVVTEKLTAKPKKDAKPAEGAHQARDLRSALAWLKAQGDLIETEKTAGWERRGTIVADPLDVKNLETLRRLRSE